MGAELLHGGGSWKLEASSSSRMGRSRMTEIARGCALACTACGQPSRPRGASTPSTSTHARPVSPPRMLDRSRPQPGERVLELGMRPRRRGHGGGERVGPAGEVVLSDVASEMTAIAAARAAALGLANVSSLDLDIESIDQPDASYDVVLCREGLMFATDHAAAAHEIVRVLRPGGRAAIAVGDRGSATRGSGSCSTP